MDINKIPSLEELEAMTEEQVHELTHPDSEVLPIYEIVKNSKRGGDTFSIGLPTFDKAMQGGLRGGDLVIVSGISGQGKTSLSQTFTYNLCARNVPTMWFSYEVSLQHLHDKFEKMGMAEHYFAYAPKKNQSGSVDWIQERIIEGWKKYLTKVIFIDHIDFLTPTDVRSSDNETIALKKIATELKQLAIHLDVAIVLMAHVKKLMNGKEPEMQDISSSAGIFQLADYVYMIHRIEEKSSGIIRKQGIIYTDKSKLKLVKNRLTGETVYAELMHQNQRFLEITNNHATTSASNQPPKGW